MGENAMQEEIIRSFGKRMEARIAAIQSVASIFT